MEWLPTLLYEVVYEIGIPNTATVCTIVPPSRNVIVPLTGPVYPLLTVAV
jgi:hypothetical protein